MPSSVSRRASAKKSVLASTRARRRGGGRSPWRGRGYYAVDRCRLIRYPAGVNDTLVGDAVARAVGDGSVWTIVVAGGSGRRFGAPKQFAPLAGRRVVDVACDTAARAGDGVVVVLPPDAIGEWSTGAATAVAGGSTRSESVRAGLAAVPDHATVICVHDAARPLATTALFRRGDRGRGRRRRRRGAGGAGGRHDQDRRTPTTSCVPPRTGRRSWPCRPRRRSAPTSCGRPTPAVTRAPTTHRSSSDWAAGWSRWRARPPTARSPRPTTSSGRTPGWPPRGRVPVGRRPRGQRASTCIAPATIRPGRWCSAAACSRACPASSVTATATRWPTPSPTPCSARPGSATRRAVPRHRPPMGRRRLGRAAGARGRAGARRGVAGRQRRLFGGVRGAQVGAAPRRDAAPPGRRARRSGQREGAPARGPRGARARRGRPVLGLGGARTSDRSDVGR